MTLEPEAWAEHMLYVLARIDDPAKITMLAEALRIRDAALAAPPEGAAVERVARAIFFTHWKHADSSIDDEQLERFWQREAAPQPETTERERCMDEARAALAAMREGGG